VGWGHRDRAGTAGEPQLSVEKRRCPVVVGTWVGAMGETELAQPEKGERAGWERVSREGRAGRSACMAGPGFPKPGE